VISRNFNNNHVDGLSENAA